MKKFLTLYIVALIILTLTGCGAEEKMGEALVEKFLEDSSGADIDIDGDIVTVKGPDGEEVTVGSTEWPKSELAKEIPEFKKGNIVTVMESNDVAMIHMEQVKEKDFTGYLEEIKTTYTVDTYEIKSEGVLTYMAANEKGLTLYISYSSEDEILSINIGKQEE